MRKILMRLVLCGFLGEALLVAGVTNTQALSLLRPPEWVVSGTSQQNTVYDCDPSECEHAISWHCSEYLDQAIVKFPGLKKSYEPYKISDDLYLDVVLEKVQLNSIIETKRIKFQRAINKSNNLDNITSPEIILKRSDPLVQSLISASKNSALARLEVTTRSELFAPVGSKAFIPLYGVEAALSSFWEECNAGKIPVGPIRN